MTIHDGGFSFLLLRDELLSTNSSLFSHTPNGGEEATVASLPRSMADTTVGLWSWLELKSLLFSSSRGICEGQYTLKLGSNTGSNDPNFCKYHQLTIPKHKMRVGV